MKSLFQDTAGIDIEIKDHRKYRNHKNYELHDIFINHSHKFIGVTKLFSYIVALMYGLDKAPKAQSIAATPAYLVS